MTSQHWPCIRPNTAPGTLFVRIVTALDNYGVAGFIARQDEELVEQWLREHPDDVIRVYIYDGDDGHCRLTIEITG